MKVLLIGVVACALLSAAGHLEACHIGECESSVQCAPGVLLACPAGDGPTLAGVGSTIYITVRDCVGHPVASIPGADFWIIGQDGAEWGLCNGSLSSSADHATLADGTATMSLAVAAGGYFGASVYVVAQGIILHGPQSLCDEPLPLAVVSPDINADGAVNNIDIGPFAVVYLGGGTDPRMDFNGDGRVTNVDFTLFGIHYMHACDTGLVR